MNSTAMVHEIVGLNGFYCTKAYGSGYAKVTSIQYSDERARRVNGQYVEVGDVVVELNGDSTANIKSQSGIVSILRSRLTSYVIKSPDMHERDMADRELAERVIEERVMSESPVRGRLARFKKIDQEWDYEKPCPHCKCVFLKSCQSRAACCKNGQYLSAESLFPKLQPLPHGIYEQAVVNVNHFSKWSGSYNKRLSISATGVDHQSSLPGHGFEKISGPHAIKIQGRTYHLIPTLASTHECPGGLSFMVFDAYEARQDELERAGQPHDGIQIPLLQKLRDELCNYNPYAKELAAIGEQAKTVGEAEDIQRLVPVWNQKSSIFEIGSIASDSSRGRISIQFKLNKEQSSLNGLSPLTEPLTYPLLFPFGEQGWGGDVGDEVTMPEYLASRILMPEQESSVLMEPTAEGDFVMRIPNARGSKILPTNRFQLMGRLKQYYLVENMSRMLDHRLQWVRRNQGRFHIGGAANRLREAEDVNEDNGEDNADGSVFLGDSFTGSPRHLGKLAHNAIHIVSVMGKPTVFITVTCNPEWPEIEERLFPGQSAFEREDVVCQVFHARLSALMHNLRMGKYFGGGKVTFEMKVIEYQHRGLPHAHIVLQLSNAPDHDNADLCVRWIDEHISATIPTTEDVQAEPKLGRLRTLIKTHMTHKCSKAVNGCLKDGVCKRGYSMQHEKPFTKFDYRGYPEYRRPRHSDLNVVPHNPQLLLDWDGHINVEFAAKTFTVLYLYKYIFKGNKKTTMRFRDEGDDTNDEIKMYLRGRMMCAMDAMWRVFGFHNYPASFPSVTLIKVKLREEVEFIRGEGKACHMAVYFMRPDCLSHLTYTAFFQMWNYQYDECGPTVEAFPIRVGVGRRRIFIYKRARTTTLIRLASVPYNCGEKFYLRLLLLYVPARSFEELMQPFDSFQKSALHRGLLKESEEALFAFQEAVVYSTAAELRTLFVMQTLQGFPTLQIFQNEELRGFLYRDYLFEKCQGDQELALNYLLKYLARSFKDEDKTLAEFGFPEIAVNFDSEIAIQRNKYKCELQKELLITLEATAPNNQEQQQLFDIIKSAVDEKKTLKIFLQGQGGSGKSTFARKIMAYVRSKGLIALGCASTGLAAQVYGMGEFQTAHSLFGIPVIEDIEDYDDETSFVTSKFSSDSERYQLLQESSLIVWDEFLSNHQHCLDAAFRLLNHFNGKVLLCMGDCRQIAPVVEHSSDPADTLRASMISSPHWIRFKVFTFQTNMRLLGLRNRSDSEFSSEFAFAKTLLNIGNADYSHNCANCNLLFEQSPVSQILRLPSLNYFHDEEQIVEFLYPEGFATERMEKRAILAGTNEACERWNILIQSLNHNELVTFSSSNALDDVDDVNGTIASMLSPYVLSRYSSTKVPPHELQLKVGDICLVVRTLNSKRDQISTNTRVRIHSMTRNTIRVQILSDLSRFYALPRIKFKFRLPYGNSFHMVRTQFPLRLAYSMTFNKSQGQEFDRVVIDSIEPPFSHGFLYVGMSRVRQSKNLAFFTVLSDVHEDAVVVQNIVYPSLLLDTVKLS